MIFTVKRASIWDYSIRPVKEAYQIETVRYDERTLASFEEYENKFSESFFDDGENHMINQFGQIQREYPETRWVVDIHSLDELIAFKEKYGRIIISTDNNNYNYERITIYDDYME